MQRGGDVARPYPPAWAVERNRDIVPAGTFAETALQDGDSLELLQFVGGG